MVTTKNDFNLERYYTETYRPQYHVTPEANWLNDPNGMVYYKNEYHLFYQYFPHGKFPNDEKYWAHVASTDMVNWEKKPIALSPDKYGSIWSGTAVVDFNNSSGFFDDTEDQTGLVAFYTVTTFDACKQRQAMAYSKDGGNTWEKYQEGKPIIDTTDDPLSDGAFRDPKVFWHDESQRWLMVVAGGPLRIFSSKDLKTWKAEAMQPEIHTECPDVFRLPLDGDKNNMKWVISGCSNWYIVGDFKRVNGVWTFVRESENLKNNCAPDVYAAQSFSNAPDGRVIKVEWMVNVSYAFETGNITDPWNGAMTIPYELELKTVEGNIRVFQNPIKELGCLRTKTHTFLDQSINDNTPNILALLQLDTFELEAVIDMGTAQDFGFIIRAGNNQFTKINYNIQSNAISLDRTNSGAIPRDNYPGVFTDEVVPVDGKIKLHMFVDRSSLEMFVQEGKSAFTSLIFPDADSNGMEFYTSGGFVRIESLKIHELKSIYRDQDPVDQLESIKVSGKKLTYELGEIFTVWAMPNSVYAPSADVEWEITSKDKIEVMEKGRDYIILKALKTGEVTIVATTTDGRLSDNSIINIA